MADEELLGCLLLLRPAPACSQIWIRSTGTFSQQTSQCIFINKEQIESTM